MKIKDKAQANRLQLHRETVLALETNDLSKVKGGLFPRTARTACYTCD